MKEKVCLWKQEDAWDFSDTYNASCGEAFTFSEGAPKDNGFKFCPYCGEKITVGMAKP